MNFWQNVSPNVAPSSPPVSERRRKGRRARRNEVAAMPGMPPMPMGDSAGMAMTAVQKALLLQQFGLGGSK